MASKNEIIAEFRTVLGGPKPIADGLIPPLVFLIVNGNCGLARRRRGGCGGGGSDLLDKTAAEAIGAF